MSLDFIGPFEHYDVVADGRVVPHLRATPLDGGRIDLTLDRRIGLVLTVAEAERFIPFLAHAMAVSLGYTSHPSDEQDGPTERHPFPKLTGLHGLGEESSSS